MHDELRREGGEFSMLRAQIYALGFFGIGLLIAAIGALP
jgi:hypothetical protein